SGPAPPAPGAPRHPLRAAVAPAGSGTVARSSVQTSNLQPELAMRISRRACLAALLSGTGLCVGCGDNSSKGMKNMQMGNERGIQKDPQTKKEKNPRPPNPLGRKPPP